MGKIKKAEINSKFKFDEKLKELGHFPTTYKNIDDLKYQFKMQLDKLLTECLRVNFKIPCWFNVSDLNHI